MDHKDLLTIGKLAELSGVHVKALRYYDRIGILPPAWVSEENGYRYYSQEHIYLVEIIKLCAEISIPLKDLKEYLSEDGSIENISELADVGIEMLKKRVKEFQEGLGFLEELKKEIQRSSDMKENNQATLIEFDATDYWLEPFDGRIDDIAYHTLLAKVFKKLEKLGLQTKYEMGTALICEEDTYRSYIFIALEDEEKNSTFDSVIRVPATSYLAKITAETRLTSANEVFPELFKKEHPKIIFELELITVQMNRSLPRYEMRCSLPAK
ncbi:MerR family transcriptional regulator [Enterococcus sp. AZ196]|uniref:MerR family transcriptional regulator n=1 Tax=Enterococcus sp. AZ196 TaxID=2774659 RepID=UPI003D2D6C9A